MWTFNYLLFSVLVSLFLSGVCVRSLLPWFWSFSTPSAQTLVTMRVIPEVEVPVYIAWIVLFVFIFVTSMSTLQVFKKRGFNPDGIVLSFIHTMLIYLVIAPQQSLFSLDQIHGWPMVGSAGVSFLLFLAGIRDAGLQYILFSVVVLRYMSQPLVQFDTGGKVFSTQREYLYYFVSRSLYIGAFYGFVQLCRYISVTYSISRIVNGKRLHIVLFGLIALSLLFLMPKSGSPIDIYFTMIPAYHIVMGGTPLVNVMSQYGLLYLAPWVVWLSFFSALPITNLAGTVVTLILLLIYFYFFIKLCSLVYRHNTSIILTVITSYFFTMLVRYVGFADPFSLVSDPPFTPLRFGIFIVPMYFLVRYVKEQRNSELQLFFLLSAVCLFYSFEVGVGIVVGCFAIALLDASLGKKASSLPRLLSHVFFICCSIVLIGILIGLGIWLRSGELPHITWYTQFALQFGNGFLSLPIAGQTGVVVPLSISLAGFVIGVADIFGGRKKIGLIPLYLAIITWVQLPYFMGRSIYPTLYNVSLPFLLLSGVLVEHGMHSIAQRKHELLSYVLVAVCGYTLVIGGVRGAMSLSDTAFHAPSIFSEALTFVKTAFTQGNVKKTSSYVFLRNTLPNRCPLILFDPNEYALLPALHARPAFQYSILRGFVTNTQQVDTLVPQWKSPIICFFINYTFMASHDDLTHPLYTYIWNRYGVSASLIATDTTNGFSLYTIPADSFVADYRDH